MRQPPSDRLSAFDLVEGFHIGHAVAALQHLGILDRLQTASTAERLARSLRLDRHLLRGVLEYVAERTQLLAKTGRRFHTTPAYTVGSRFLLNLYVGAYGRNGCRLETILAQPDRAPAAVNRTRHARAFSEDDGSASRRIAAILLQLGLNHVLDIGCGPAALLRTLATEDRAFVGWGLEPNPAMLRTARTNLRAAGLARRVRVFQGDAATVRDVLPADVRSRTRAVVASQVANEMFRKGPGQAVRWLRGLRRCFPGRPLILADYYGRLGTGLPATGRETLLHDYAQLISGQGIPPATAGEWREIAGQAGCTIAQVLEDTRTSQFLHIILLGRRPRSAAVA